MEHQMDNSTWTEMELKGYPKKLFKLISVSREKREITMLTQDLTKYGQTLMLTMMASLQLLRVLFYLECWLVIQNLQMVFSSKQVKTFNKVIPTDQLQKPHGLQKLRLDQL